MNNPTRIPSTVLGVALLAAAPLALSRAAEESPATAPAAPAAEKIDFQSLEPGEVPDDFMVTDQDAQFRIVAEGENKLLELEPLPLAEGGLLAGKSIKGGAIVKARVRAEAKRRSHPRFGVGLHGAGGFRLRAVPARKMLEISKGDSETAAEAPLEDYQPGEWTVLELSVRPSPSGGSIVEGRCWREGQPRPEKPQVTHAAETPPGNGRASVWATPFAGLPVFFDDLEITPAP